MFNLQGGWEEDETMEKAARRETLEEAGVIGDVEVIICLNTILIFFLSLNYSLF